MQSTTDGEEKMKREEKDFFGAGTESENQGERQRGERTEE